VPGRSHSHYQVIPTNEAFSRTRFVGVTWSKIAGNAQHLHQTRGAHIINDCSLGHKATLSEDLDTDDDTNYGPVWYIETKPDTVALVVRPILVAYVGQDATLNCSYDATAKPWGRVGTEAPAAGYAGPDVATITSGRAHFSYDAPARNMEQPDPFTGTCIPVPDHFPGHLRWWGVMSGAMYIQGMPLTLPLVNQEGASVTPGVRVQFRIVYDLDSGLGEGMRPYVRAVHAWEVIP